MLHAYISMINVAVVIFTFFSLFHAIDKDMVLACNQIALNDHLALADSLLK